MQSRKYGVSIIMIYFIRHEVNQKLGRAYCPGLSIFSVCSCNPFAKSTRTFLGEEGGGGLGIGGRKYKVVWFPMTVL